MVGGKKKVTITKDTTAPTGPDTGSARETGELKDRDFFLGRKLKFGQEIGLTHLCLQSAHREVLGHFGHHFGGAEPPFSWQASTFLPGSLWGLE